MEIFYPEIPVEEAKCYLHRSARNPVLPVLQTSKCKQVTHLNTEAGPKGPGCVICAATNRHDGVASSSAGVAEKVTRDGATGAAGARQSGGGSMWDQERNDSERPLNSERQGTPRASRGRVGGTMPFPAAHLDVPTTVSSCGRETGLDTITPRELGNMYF